MNDNKDYHTELDWDSGLTFVVCNHCQMRHYAGTEFIHSLNCPERNRPRPARRITEILQTITFKQTCEIDENGLVIQP